MAIVVMPTEPAAAFRSRLEAAIDHLSQLHLGLLRERHPGIAGPRGLVAAASGMPGPSTLSDILAGRIPGTSYRPRLAEVLRVDPAWLEDGSGEAPDWSLHPIAAWRRYVDRLRRHAAVQDEEGSQSRRGRAQLASRISLIAGRYGLDPRTATAEALVLGRFDEIPFDLVLKHARSCGLADPADPDILRRGQAEWAAVRTDIASKTAEAQAQVLRFVPPPRMFALIREALTATMATHGGRPVADALEMLHRQQWAASGLTRADGTPAELARDTGRTEWTPIRELRQRWTP